MTRCRLCRRPLTTATSVELTLLLTVLEFAVIEAELLGTGHLAASHVKGR